MSETTARAMRRATSGSLTTPIFPLLAATATGFALPGAERYVHMGPVPPKKDGDHLSFGKFQKRLPVSVHPRHGLSVDAKEDVPLTDPALPRPRGPAVPGRGSLRRPSPRRPPEPSGTAGGPPVPPSRRR